MNGEVDPYLKKSVDRYLIKAQGLERVNGVISYGVSENVISSGAFVTVVVVASALWSLGGDLCRVCTNVVPPALSQCFLEGGDVLSVGI